MWERVTCIDALRLKSYRFDAKISKCLPAIVHEFSSIYRVASSKPESNLYIITVPYTRTSGLILWELDPGGGEKLFRYLFVCWWWFVVTKLISRIEKYKQKLLFIYSFPAGNFYRFPSFLMIESVRLPVQLMFIYLISSSAII